MDGFGIALREWRERRRLSQLDLAVRAGTTQRHLSYLERGRSAPGRGMVIRLAESLDLPLRERNELLMTAGFVPAYPQTRVDDPALGVVRDALQRILDGHQPYPAIVIDRYGEIVARNKASDLLIEGAAPELLEPPINALRIALHPKGMAPRIRNAAQWSHHVLRRLRLDSMRNPDPKLSALLAELETYAPEATPVRDTQLGFAVPLRLAHGADELCLVTTITSFATAVDVTVAELKLEAFLPLDELTATVLSAR
jgi:transcriptional regulator with XRE-family HTH domain